MATAATVFRDYETDGVPGSGAKKPKKSEIRQLLAGYETIINAFLTNGGLIFASLSSLNSSLNYAANTMAWVLGDATVANNGVYRKIGGSGTGSWTRVSDLPFSFIIASDVGAGTANAIQATTSIPVSSSALVWMNIFEANTSTPVTVSFNGGSALTIKTNSGNNVVAGGLVSGTIVMGIVSGSTFRLISDQASAAILAEAESLVGRAGQLPETLLAYRALTVAPGADEYKLVVPGLPTIEQFKTPTTTYSDALAAAKTTMAGLGTAAGSGPGMFVVPPGTDIGDATADSYLDTIRWFMPGSKGFGSNRARIEQHVNNIANWPGFSEHYAHAFAVERYFDGSVGADGYLKAGAAIRAFAATGQHAPAIGTPFAMMQEHLVFDLATSADGRNEPAINYSYIEAIKGRTQNTANFWAEDTIAISPAHQSGWFGGSRRLHKMAAGRDTDSGSWLGSVAYSAVTRPLFNGEWSPQSASRLGDSTHMIDAMFWGGGWAGEINVGNTVNTGTAAGATVGVDTVFRAGGPGGSPYIGDVARSFINTVLMGQDYAKDGIILLNPHPTFDNDDYAAIRIAEDAGRMFIGINGPVAYSNAMLVVGNSALDDGVNIRLQDSRHITSKRATMDINSKWLLGMDFARNGTEDFFLYHNFTDTRPFGVGVDGHFNLIDSALYRNGTKVVDTRRTGWSLMTGGTNRGGFATSTVTLEQLATVMKALLDDMFAHGLIGPTP